MTASKTSANRAVKCGRCRHPRALHSNGATPCKARGCHAGPDGTPCPGWQGQVGGFMITDDMITRGPDGEPKPGFSVTTVATVFVGRSAAWLRLQMRQVAGFPDVYRSRADDRWFSLADLERAAYALREADVIDDSRFTAMITMTVWCARQHGLLGYPYPGAGAA